MVFSQIKKIKSLLFENNTVRQTIFKNTFWLTMADMVNKLLKLVLLIYVARILGATEYGKFNFAFAFVYLFSVIANLGVGEITVREFAKEEGREKEFPSIISLKILLSLGAMIFIFFGSFLITHDSEIHQLIWILAIYLLMDSFIYLFCCFFRARQQMQYEALSRAIQALMLTGVGFFMLFNFPSPQGLSYSYVISALVALVFLLMIFLFKARSIKIEWDRSIWRKYLVMSWPLALVAALTMIYNQIDSVMMGHLNQMTETGWYNAAYRIAGSVLVLNGLISISFYPVLSKYFKESKELLQKVWNYHMEIMIFLSFPLMVGGVILAPKIINFIYDKTFAPSILAFQILIVMVGVSFLQSPFNYILIAANQQKKLFWAILSGAIINVILNLILIPRFSLYGASVATLFTWLVLLSACAYFTYRYTPISPVKSRLLRMGIISVLSAAIMAAVILSANIYNLIFFFSISIGFIVYIAAFLVLRFITKKLNYAYVKK